MDARQQRGMEIAATKRLRKVERGWAVPAASGAWDYEVSKGLPGTPGLVCTCPDYELRAQPCKHIYAVEIVVRRETPDGEVFTEALRVTYSQPWAAYNAAQCEEKARFMPMLADLCSTISNHRRDVDAHGCR